MDTATGLCITIDPPPLPSTRRSTHPHSHGTIPSKRTKDDHVDPAAASVPDHQQPSLVSMRSSKGMAGLLLAEVGASMVELDVVAGLSGGSGFKDGERIEPGVVTPIAVHARTSSSSTEPVVLPASARTRNAHTAASHNLGAIDADLFDPRRKSKSRETSRDDEAQGFARSGTLLNMYASPARKASELTLLLGDASGKVKHGAAVVVSHSSTSASLAVRTSTASNDSKNPSAIAFEQGKSKALVSLDLVLENNICVEGGDLSGIVCIRVRSPSKSRGGESEFSVSLGGAKIRIAGFEVVQGRSSKSLRHIFYQVSAPLADISSSLNGSPRVLFPSPPDKEGFASVQAGKYSISFSMPLPVTNTAGKPKGAVQNKSFGVLIRYIAIASIKIVDRETGKRSIAHFYRDVEVWPRLEPANTLFFNASRPLSQPLQASSVKKLGANGELHLTAELSRATWVAGQRCYVRVHISNLINVQNSSKSKKKGKRVRSVTLSLSRTVRVFRPSPKLDTSSATAHGHNDILSVDPDACETETTERKIVEEMLHAGQRGCGEGVQDGYASARGWWTGVGTGESGTVVCSVAIPSDALSVPRARFLEVEYTLRVSLRVGSNSITGSADAVDVSLPVRIVNFISLDPPPPSRFSAGSHSHPRSSAVGNDSAAAEMDTPRASQSVSAFSGLGTSVSGVSTSSTSADSSSSQRSRTSKAKTAARVRVDPSASMQSTRLSDAQNSRTRGRPTGLPVPSHSLPLIHFAAVSHRDTAIASAGTVSSDLGGLEDEDELHDVFGGEIPGSASLLEEQYMSVLQADRSVDDVGFDDDGDEHGWEDLHLHPARGRPAVKSKSGGRRTSGGAPRDEKLGRKGNKLAKKSAKPKKEEVSKAERKQQQPLPRPPRMQEFVLDGDEDELLLERVLGRSSDNTAYWDGPPDSGLSSMNQSDSQTTNASFRSGVNVNESDGDEGDVAAPGYQSGGVNTVQGILLNGKQTASRVKKGTTKRLEIDVAAAAAAFPAQQVIVKGPGSPHKHTFSERVQMKKSMSDESSAASTSINKSKIQSGSVASRSTDNLPVSSAPSNAHQTHSRAAKMGRAQTTPSSSTKILAAESATSSISRLGNGLGGVRARIAMLEEAASSAQSK